MDMRKLFKAKKHQRFSLASVRYGRDSRGLVGRQRLGLVALLDFVVLRGMMRGFLPTDYRVGVAMRECSGCRRAS